VSDLEKQDLQRLQEMTAGKDMDLVKDIYFGCEGDFHAAL